jgi:hypothetical protein
MEQFLCSDRRYINEINTSQRDTYTARKQVILPGTGKQKEEKKCEEFLYS